jgi:hypothetical protein
VFDSVDQGVIPAEMSVPHDEVVLDDDQQAAIKKLKLMRMKLRGKARDEVVEEDENDESSSESETEELKEWRRKKREAEAEADQNSITSFVFDSIHQGVFPTDMTAMADCEVPPASIDDDDYSGSEESLDDPVVTNDNNDEGGECNESSSKSEMEEILRSGDGRNARLKLRRIRFPPLLFVRWVSREGPRCQSVAQATHEPAPVHLKLLSGVCRALS